jgi:hypothetical protein
LKKCEKTVRVYDTLCKSGQEFKAIRNCGNCKNVILNWFRDIWNQSSMLEGNAADFQYDLLPISKVVCEMSISVASLSK